MADLRELIDLRTPWCVRVVATLRIANHIVAGISDVEGLAKAAGCDADSLDRVLAHLAGKGLFQSAGPGRYALTESSHALLDESRVLSLDLDGVGGRFADAWGTLLAAVRTGECAYPQRYGMTFWEDLAAHPELGESFDALMGTAGHGTPDPDVLVTGDWDSVRTVVDVGGGTGALLAEILRARPDVRGTLVDLPRTVARSADTFRTAGVSERVTTVGQSFFDALPRDADLYVLSAVLNDWQDREALVILRRCAEAMPPSGCVVVLGGVAPDDAPDQGAALDVEMVLVRGLGGKPRTVAAFRRLAAEAGLTLTAAERQTSGRFVVECRKT